MSSNLSLPQIAKHKRTHSASSNGTNTSQASGPMGLGLIDENEVMPSFQMDHDYDIRNGLAHEKHETPYSNESRYNMLSPSQFTPYANSDSGLSDGEGETAFMPAGGGRAGSVDVGTGSMATFSPQGSIVSPSTPQSSKGFASSNTEMDTPTAMNPFNFTTVQYSSSPKSSLGRSSAGNEAMGKRRGHKYRHSSIHATAMESIFRPPTPQKAPLTVPASLHTPTFAEAWRNMDKVQRRRLAWCVCHFSIAGYVQFTGSGSLTMTALSRLLLFDAVGATVCVVVDVMGNFPVWKHSSIKHPFGLARADVLAGFGMAVFIAFMGLDVVSHGVQHSLENVGNHAAHSPHEHGQVTVGDVDIASAMAVISTLVSAVLLKNHVRMAKAMRFELRLGWGKILGNPLHTLTLSCAATLLLLPYLSPSSYFWIDKLLSFIIASLMIAVGVRLGSSLGSMLLMSYSPRAADGAAVRAVIQEISHADPAVSSVEEPRFWQVHYELCMASLKVHYRRGPSSYATGDDLLRLRQKISQIIQKRLGGAKWDISIEVIID